MKNRPHENAAGLAFLEILIAFAILAMASIPIFRLFSTTSKGMIKSGEYTAAIFLCQKVIEDIRYNLYNEDSTDFRAFLKGVAEGGSTPEKGKKLIPGSECSRYYLGVLDENNEADQAIIRQMQKFTVTVESSSYKSEVDVDGDGINDPDAALITVTVFWKEKVPEQKKEVARHVRFSTVISKRQNQFQDSEKKFK